MLSASGDFVPLNLWQRALLGANGKWSKNSSEIHTYVGICSKCSHHQGTWIPAKGLCLWTSCTWASSQTILQARSSKLAQILPSYGILYSITPVLLYNHICRKTSIATLRSFSFTASAVWDRLPVHVSSVATLPVFRRQAPFIPSSLPWIHTDHQSQNLLQYQVFHLTRSSPALTISWFLHSRLSLAKYWRVCKFVIYSLTY